MSGARITIDDNAVQIITQFAAERNISLKSAANIIINMLPYHLEEIERLQAKIADLHYRDKKDLRKQQHERWMREHNLNLF